MPGEGREPAVGAGGAGDPRPVPEPAAASSAPSSTPSAIPASPSPSGVNSGASSGTDSGERSATGSASNPATDSTSNPATNPATTPGTGSSDGDHLVYNNFYGPQYHGRAHFGIATATERSGRARATGLLEGDEIDALLRSYIRPDCFDDATRELSRTRVVVLTGPQGTGKRSGAVALLRETVGPSADYVVLSPDIGLDQLAERTFDAGVGYVVLDRTGTAGAAGGAASDFDWRRVRDQLRRHRAHLVITTVHGAAGRPPEAVRHLPWRPPAPDKVVRARLVQARMPKETVDRAVAGIPAHCPIAVVADAAQRIAAGTDPDQAWKEHSGSAPQAVQEWFGVAEQERSLREIAEVTTLAFALGIGRRAFESLQDVLERLLEPVYAADPADSAHSGHSMPPVHSTHSVPDAASGTADGAAPDAAGQAAGGPVRRQRHRTRPVDRRRSLARNSLITTEMQIYGATTREVMVFADADLRRWVLEALWRDHPTEYWDAVRHWLGLVVDADPDPVLQLSIASGLTLLGHIAFDEVVQSYLDPWARGESGEAGQTLAVYVLWYMCLEETQAAAALTLARTWAQSTHPTLRGTALCAFGGQLGVTFPTDAVKWLWAMLRSGVPDKRDERELGLQAWAQLFLTLVDCQEDAGIVLDALAHRIRKEQRTRSAAYSATGLLVLETTLWVFSATERLSARPAVARYLADRPAETGVVAELWAAALCYRPLRRSALSALRQAARALPAVTSDPAAVAERLGQALAAALPQDEHPLLVSELGRPAVARPARATDPDCVAILLGALNRAKDSHPR
ncbi:hypothetical protein [Streptomyces sp. RTGN2]|uniref:hypothetical protein n=1 Tax=Streptomyces sp. RTGN2 TaxID=3016525 RepID=UPI00255710F2|nr:hypothetical protein [Streptomyces sp. RTGN2]